MKSLNLLPARIQVRISQRRRLRRWSVFLTAYITCLSLAGFAFRVSTVVDSDLTDQIASEQTKVDAFQVDQVQGKRLMTSLRKQIDAANATGRHPNWGILLNVVAQALNANTVLDNIALVKTRIEPPAPAKTATAAQVVAPRTDFTLALQGRAQSMDSMGQLLVSLEKFAVFRQVRLGDNQRIETPRGSVFQFTITCTLDTSDPSPAAGETK